MTNTLSREQKLRLYNFLKGLRMLGFDECSWDDLAGGLAGPTSIGGLSEADSRALRDYLLSDGARKIGRGLWDCAALDLNLLVAPEPEPALKVVSRKRVPAGWLERYENGRFHIVQDPDVSLFDQVGDYEEDDDSDESEGEDD